jgi:NADPH:quinone reductase-like Zn-dependent oxidoreductase
VSWEPTPHSTTNRDVVAAVKELTSGGAHVVVDHVGEATWQRSLAAARADGRICVCGATSGPNPPAQLHRIWWKQLTIYGSTMGSRTDFEAVYELVTRAARCQSSTMSFRSPKRRRARTARSRRAARQDRAADPGVVSGGGRAESSSPG